MGASMIGGAGCFWGQPRAKALEAARFVKSGPLGLAKH
jgi:hypothetical protein